MYLRKDHSIKQRNHQEAKVSYNSQQYLSVFKRWLPWCVKVSPRLIQAFFGQALAQFMRQASVALIGHSTRTKEGSIALSKSPSLFHACSIIQISRIVPCLFHYKYLQQCSKHSLTKQWLRSWVKVCWP